MKIVTILGARPQFIKAAPLGSSLRAAGHRDLWIHTGQHYDAALSQVFFDELEIPKPDFNLNAGSGSHARQTALMLTGIEEILIRERPDCVLVYGDTNSTLAGALAAAKMRMKIAHVEAGLRSFNREMPEEINRILTDHCSDLLFCPTETAVANLSREGVRDGVHRVGDTMYDSVLHFASSARERSGIGNRLRLVPGEYLLVTIHRAYNTDSPESLRGILSALGDVNETVVFPVHPRTRKMMCAAGLEKLAGSKNVRLIDPVGYLDMLALEQNARLILTDSGGVQKEAYFLSVPCITLRPETEWVETVESGWNTLAGTDRDRILDLIESAGRPSTRQECFGDGRAAHHIREILEKVIPG